MSGMIRPRVPWDEYCRLPGARASHLKELRRSPLHYQHLLANPTETSAMRLGTAAHIAVLEPHRFESTYAIWDRRTESGRLSPRTGKQWEAFVAQNSGRVLISDSEAETALEIQRAVRSNPFAMRYLKSGEPEVTIQWETSGRLCKGRMDWLTMDCGAPVVVGLKTARDARPYLFGSQAAKLGYHLQWAYYFDGFRSIRSESPKMVEIVVENKPPYASAVYNIPSDIIDQGRDEYLEALALLDECERKNEWPGPVVEEQDLTLPSWVYESTDDLTDIGLEA